MLVRALLVVEHDREKHIPGVKTGPNAETFLVPEDVASSLVAAGAVERVEAVVDTDQLLDAPATTAVDNAKVVTFAVLGTASTTMDAGKVVAFAVLEPGVATPSGQHRMLALF